MNIHKGGHVDVEHAERMLKAAGHKVPETKPTLEVNPHHPLVSALKHEPDEKRFADWSHILLDQAVLAEGGQLDEPGAFVKRLNELMLALAGTGLFMTGNGQDRSWGAAIGAPESGRSRVATLGRLQQVVMVSLQPTADISRA